MEQMWKAGSIAQLNSGKGCEMKFYDLLEQSKGHYRFGNRAENDWSDLFVGEKAALVLDTGYGYDDWYRLVRDITDLPLYVVDSHGHVDHSAGNFRFPGSIYIHEKDMELCKEHNSLEFRRNAVEHGKHCRSRRMDHEENILPENFDAEAYIHGGWGNLKALNSKHCFDLGGLTLQVLELPGHTGGSIGLYCPEKRTACVGDAMNDTLWLFLKDSSSLTEYISSVRRVLESDIDSFYISHFPDARGRKVLKEYMELAQSILDDPEKRFKEGRLFESLLCEGKEVRICFRDGYDMDDFGKEGFCCIYLSRDQLN